MRTVLFLRGFRTFRGGHLKVWDYFNHVLASPHFTPRVAFPAATTWDSTNPWSSAREYVVEDWQSLRPDVFFVGGRDWALLDRHRDAKAGLPVINLVQHVRHAEETGTRFEFLRRKAIRICVSEEVAGALRATGLTVGPLIVIPNGVDLRLLPRADASAADVDV